MKKIGIITFHNSYNCGSMLESYAMQTILKKMGMETEIINFSNEGQKEIYNYKFKNNSIKNIIKNILIFPAIKKIKLNNYKYEEFKNKNFILSENEYSKQEELTDYEYSTVVAGSDQIWNITIEDGDDAYFLPWVKKARRVAYAPSFGSKKIAEHTDNINKYIDYLNKFDAISIREQNGNKWIKEMIGQDVPVLLDPTMLLNKEDYDKIKDNNNVKDKYIFFYAPSFDTEICRFVKKVADKYNLKVITWSTKSYFVKLIRRFGFELPDYEDPSVYLNLIANAELVFTTSYHGTIFSTIYKKKFFTIKNGGMYGNDDRVLTLLNQLNMLERLTPFEFDDNKDYLEEVNYEKYDSSVDELKNKAFDYINKNIKEFYENEERK